MARKRQFARYQPFVVDESIYGLRHVRARAGNAANSSEISRRLEENGSIDEVYRTMLLSLLTVDDRDDPRTDKIETRDVTQHRRKSNALKKRKPNIDIMEQEAGCDVEEQIDPDYEFILRQLKDLDKSSVLKFEKGVVPLSQAIKYEVDMGDDGDGVVQIDKQQFYQNPAESLRRVRKRLDKGKKAVVEDDRLVQCRREHVAHAQSVKESSSKIVPAEVEILDNDMVVKKGMFGHFVPSMQFHSSMMDKDPEDYGLPIASEDFRTEVLKVLRKPYNKEEYHKCRKQIRDGSYTYYHPDLQTKLTRFRYKRDKCLIVLRGFLFWLQNLTRQGAFEPWKDRECLAVELPSC